VYLGRQERGRLVYAGKLERGFGDQDKRRILAMFDKLRTKKQPITAPRTFPRAQWVQPRVLVDAEYEPRPAKPSCAILPSLASGRI
jgi:bifunctional non-homologous end joining protein LigD